MFFIRWTEDNAAFGCVQKVSASLNMEYIKIQFVWDSLIHHHLVWAWSCCSPKYKSDSRSINYSAEGENKGGGCAPFNMVNHIQSSHMYHQLQSRIMNQLCLLTVTVRLSSGLLECAVRPWPLQSHRCGQPLNLFPLPLSLSVSLTRLQIDTVGRLSLDENTLSL